MRWKKIPKFPTYYISDTGLIRVTGSYSDGRRKTPRLLKVKIGNVCLRKDGRNWWFKIAQLVLRAFIGPPPKGKYLARHLDDNPLNNSLNNLAWGDHKDNTADAIRNGRQGTGTIVSANRSRGKPRPLAVRLKISATKRRFPERQHYAREHGPDGRFIRSVS